MKLTKLELAALAELLGSTVRYKNRFYRVVYIARGEVFGAEV